VLKSDKLLEIRINALVVVLVNINNSSHEHIGVFRYEWKYLVLLSL